MYGGRVRRRCAVAAQRSGRRRSAAGWHWRPTDETPRLFAAISALARSFGAGVGSCEHADREAVAVVDQAAGAHRVVRGGRRGERGARAAAVLDDPDGDAVVVQARRQRRVAEPRPVAGRVLRKALVRGPEQQPRARQAPRNRQRRRAPAERHAQSVAGLGADRRPPRRRRGRRDLLDHERVQQLLGLGEPRPGRAWADHRHRVEGALLGAEREVDPAAQALVVPHRAPAQAEVPRAGWKLAQPRGDAGGVARLEQRDEDAVRWELPAGRLERAAFVGAALAQPEGRRRELLRRLGEAGQLLGDVLPAGRQGPRDAAVLRRRALRRCRSGQRGDERERGDEGERAHASGTGAERREVLSPVGAASMAPNRASPRARVVTPRGVRRPRAGHVGDASGAGQGGERERDAEQLVTAEVMGLSLLAWSDEAFSVSRPRAGAGGSNTPASESSSAAARPAPMPAWRAAA